MRQPFSTSAVSAVILVTLGLAGGTAAGEMPTAEDLTENLKAAEMAFAQTMADRDHAAFSSFLAEEAVFFNGENELRGKAAVASAWKPFFEGPAAPFSWRPDTAAARSAKSIVGQPPYPSGVGSM